MLRQLSLSAADLMQRRAALAVLESAAEPEGCRKFRSTRFYRRSRSGFGCSRMNSRPQL